MQEVDGNDSWGYNPAFFFAWKKLMARPYVLRVLDACTKEECCNTRCVLTNATGAHPFANFIGTHQKPEQLQEPMVQFNATDPYSVSRFQSRIA